MISLTRSFNFQKFSDLDRLIKLPCPFVGRCGLVKESEAREKIAGVPETGSRNRRAVNGRPQDPSQPSSSPGVHHPFTLVLEGGGIGGAFWKQSGAGDSDAAFFECLTFLLLPIVTYYIAAKKINGCCTENQVNFKIDAHINSGRGEKVVRELK